MSHLSLADHLYSAIRDLASAPRGGVFTSRYDRQRDEVHWGYVWREGNGCRSAIAGWISEPPQVVEIHSCGPDPRADRYGLSECFHRAEDLDGMAWVSGSFGTTEYELANSVATEYGL